MEKNPVFSSFSSFEEFQTAWRKLPSLASQMQFAANISYEQLMIQDLKNRNRVVHVLALDSKWINELPITCPGDDPRCFVPRRFLTPELLLIKGNGGNSVAHWMLWSDCLPMRLLTPEILLCATDEKRTVLYDIPLLLNSMLDRHTEYALAQIEKIPCAVFPLLLEEVERTIDYIPASRNEWKY